MYETESVNELGKEIFDMFEYRPMGNGKYAVQTGTERLLAETAADGAITDFCYSINKEGSSGYELKYSLFGSGAVPGEDRVNEKADSVEILAVRHGQETKFIQ